MRDSIKTSKAEYDVITKISEHDRSALVEEWQKLFGTVPAKNTSSAILMRIIIYEVQCRTYGGLSAASKRVLRNELGNSYRKSPSSASLDIGKVDSKSEHQIAPAKQQTSQPPLLSAGTQLIREWNGRPYRVEVTDGGFTLDGKNYRSLSAIAKKITGVHWSGPRFFGLNASKPMKASGAITEAVQ